MSVWNSPGSCVMLADGKSKARTSTSVTQVNSAVFESRFQIHILYLQSELVCYRQSSQNQSYGSATDADGQNICEFEPPT